jgi:hypothetical protein
MDISEFHFVSELKTYAVQIMSINTLLHVFEAEQKGTKDERRMRKLCLELLTNVIHVYQSSKIEDSKNKQECKEANFEMTTEEDVRKVQTIDKRLRTKLLRSKIYTCYKVLWIFKMLIAGRSFKHGHFNT